MAAVVRSRSNHTRRIGLGRDFKGPGFAAHDSPGYQTALRALGNAAKRDVRIVEGLA